MYRAIFGSSFKIYRYDNFDVEYIFSMMVLNQLFSYNDYFIVNALSYCFGWVAIKMFSQVLVGFSLTVLGCRQNVQSGSNWYFRFAVF